MAVSFGFTAKRQRLSPAEAFSDAAEPSDALPPALSAEEALAASQREQDAGEAFATDRHFFKALRSWNRGLALTPDRAVLHELKAQALMELDHIWEALQCASRATQLAPEWPEAHLTLGRAHLEMGEPELALASMEEVLRLQPDHAEARIEISTVQMLVQQRKQQNPQGGQRLSVVKSSAQQSS